MKKVLLWLYVLIGIAGYGITNASVSYRFNTHHPIKDRLMSAYCGIMWPVFIPLTGYIDYRNGDKVFVHGWKL